MQRFAVLVVLVIASSLASEVKAQSLTISGPCPGVMTFEVSGAAPEARLAFIYSNFVGSWTIPPGFPCAGLVTGLGTPIGFGGWVEADAAGDATVNASIPGGWCGSKNIQVVDALACTTTPVVVIP